MSEYCYSRLRLALLFADSLQVTAELLALLVRATGALMLVDDLAALLGGVAALAVVSHVTYLLVFFTP